MDRTRLPHGGCRHNAGCYDGSKYNSQKRKSQKVAARAIKRKCASKKVEMPGLQATPGVVSAKETEKALATATPKRESRAENTRKKLNDRGIPASYIGTIWSLMPAA